MWNHLNFYCTEELRDFSVRRLAMGNLNRFGRLTPFFMVTALMLFLHGCSSDDKRTLQLTSSIEVSSDALSFGSEVTELNITLTNTGDKDLDWELADSYPDWISPSVMGGELLAGESEVVTITVDRTGLAEDLYEYDLVINTYFQNVDDATLSVFISMIVADDMMTLPLLKSGLTVSYDADGIEKNDLRDDGYWQYGEDFNYTDNGDGTVTDQVTSLRWMQNGSDSEYTFDEAQTYCADLTTDGGGWRIPNIYEYYTILNFSQENPAMDHTYFPESTKSYYWTSTATYDWSGRVWTIREPYADDNPYELMTVSRYVRCVKGNTLVPPDSNRFVASGSDTVTDTWTGLIWESASDHNDATGYTWEEAIAYCEAKTTAGLEWHLPNIKQVQSVLAKNAAEPAIDTTFFSNDSYTLWTSSTDAYTNGGSMEFAWAVSEGGYGDFVLASLFKISSSDDYSQPVGVRCVSW